jgi:hypothetical protein
MSEYLLRSTNTSPKKKSGGKKQGAGRPSIIGKSYHYKADADLVPVLDMQINRNRFINDAVREKIEKDETV